MFYDNSNEEPQHGRVDNYEEGPYILLLWN